MKNLFRSALDWVSKHFTKDPSKMLVWTGVAGWALSSAAQIGALLLNPKISNEQKSYLVPQELADAVVNIGMFFVFTQSAKALVSKLFSTGKFAPTKVRKYLELHKDKYGSKIGKFDFCLDDFTKAKVKDFPKEEYFACKNYASAIATVSAGVLSSNIVTPLLRNCLASKIQKNYIDSKKQEQVKKPNIQQPTFKSYGTRI